MASKATISIKSSRCIAFRTSLLVPLCIESETITKRIKNFALLLFTAKMHWLLVSARSFVRKESKC